MRSSSRGDFFRELENVTSAPDVGRLEATHQLGEMLQEELRDMIFQGELMQIRRPRKLRRKAPWTEIGRALGISHTAAIKRFGDHVD